MTNDDDERERAAKRQKRHAAVFQNAKNELEKLENEHLEALEVIDEVNAHLTSRWPKSHDGLSSANCRELLRSIKRLEEAEKRVSDIERIDLTSLTTRKKNKTSSECHTKKKEEQSSAMTATTTTTKGAKCMAIKIDGAPCDKHAEAGFLTCRYRKHRAQEEELREKSGVPRTDSTASTATNDQAPPPTQPPVVTRKGSRLKPPGVTKKRKRGDEEELEHTDHSPSEIVPDCPACAAGCGELTQPSYRFDSPEPEERGLPLPPCPTLNGPILPSPTSTDEAEQTGFRPQDEVMRALTTTAFFRDPGHYISDTRARAVRACEAAAKRKADEEEKRKAEEEAKRRAEEEEKRKAEEEAKRRAEEEEKRKAEEEAKHKAEEYIKSLEEGTVVDTARTLASIMESFRKGEDNRLEELCKELQGKLLHKRIEDFIKDNKFTLPVSVVKDRFEEYKITCQEPYSGDMSRARKQEEMKDRCNRRKVTANVKRAMKFRKDRLRL